MANSEETLEQAVSRISRCLQSELCDGMSLAEEARAVEAAIRQGIAWAYRDAAKAARTELPSGDISDSVLASRIARENVAKELEELAELAEEVGRG